MNREDCRPTYESILKQQRSSNYDILRSLAEFIDNSVDANADEITIDFIYDDDKKIYYEIILKDNGTGIFNLKETATHGYKRQRCNKECSEFGCGYKYAAMNISEKYTIYTKNCNDTYKESIWDQRTMSKNDKFIPVISDCTYDKYIQYSNYITGTTVKFEALRSQTTNSIDIENISNYLKKRYRYILNDSQLKFILIDNNKTTEINKTHTIDNIIDNQESKHFTQTDLSIYQDTDNNKLHFKLENSDISILNDKIEKEVMRIKIKDDIKSYKNNNYNYKPSGFEFDTNIEVFDNYEFIGKINFTTWNYDFLENKKYSDLEWLNIPQGKVSICRKNFVISDNNISFRPEYGDGYSNYISHQLSYVESTLDTYLGTTVNKQNNGSVQDSSLYIILQYIQKKHEKPLRDDVKEKKKERDLLK